MSKVYQSLARPKLKKGGQWHFTAGIGLFTIFMVLETIASRRLWPALVGLVCYWPALKLARWAAKHDPDWLAVYFRSMRHAQTIIREPHGYAFTRDSEAPQIMLKPAKWVK